MGHNGNGPLSYTDAPVPARGVNGVADAGPDVGAGSGAGRRVLLVEDEPNISEAIRYILRRDGFEVAILGSGEGVLEQVAALDPHLVILDVMLPGISGLDILRALRGQPRTAALPVILLTAKGSAATREMAREAGASAFMAKPFANAELLATARQLVGV